jgi:hypothetical protein
MGVEHARKFAMQTIAHRVGSYEDPDPGSMYLSSRTPIRDPCHQRGWTPHPVRGDRSLNAG